MKQPLKKIFKKQVYWKEINNIISKLQQEGFDAFIVGGAVRDALLNRAIKDIDIASSAKPEQIIKLLPKANSSFAKYGVVFIPLKNNQKIEITTFRKDFSYKDGRRPQTVKYSSIKEDVARRDFTINALFYDVKKEQIIDLTKGLTDLKNKKIKTAGKAEKRFKEDHLRMLRALRLAHQLNFQLDKEIKLALLKLNKNIKSISKERILDELMKMFSVGKIDRAIKKINDYGLFQYIFPELALSEINVKPSRNQSFKTPFDLKNITHSYLKKKKNINIKQKYIKFWKCDFSFFMESAFCWTVVGLPFFYSDIKKFSNFLNAYPIKSTVIKQAVFYLKSVQTLTNLKSSFIDQLLAFNGFEKQVYELTYHFLNSGHLKNQQKLKQKLKFIFKEFKKREIKGRLPPALITGSDLLNLTPAVKRQNFSKILRQAFSYQMENLSLTKKEILKKLKI